MCCCCWFQHLYLCFFYLSLTHWVKTDCAASAAIYVFTLTPWLMSQNACGCVFVCVCVRVCVGTRTSAWAPSVSCQTKWTHSIAAVSAAPLLHKGILMEDQHWVQRKKWIISFLNSFSQTSQGWVFVETVWSETVEKSTLKINMAPSKSQV